MINIYKYDIARNKFGLVNKSMSALKKRLIKKRGLICEICGNDFSEFSLQLDHIIPVYVGGHLFDESNLSLICIKCHSKKTALDKRIIFIMKKIGILLHCGYDSYFEIEVVKKWYLDLKKVIEEIEQKDKIYFNGESLKDYKFVYQKSNRTIINP